MSFQTRLFVGNLPENINENDLRSAFSAYGEITNLDLKSKSAGENDAKKFAFVTISASNHNVESCIKDFSSQDYQGKRLYVTRARESFLERLQKEREQTKNKEGEKVEHEHIHKGNRVIKLGDKFNPRKRKYDNNINGVEQIKSTKLLDKNNRQFSSNPQSDDGIVNKDVPNAPEDIKKVESDKKRMEAIKKKRKEFKDKQMIIKTALIGVDKVPNKKVIFTDDEEISSHDKSAQKNHNENRTKERQEKRTLFDNDDESEDEVNFEIKEQYEGKKGQKVLDLQSRYKSDKRFILDERFIEDGQSEDEENKEDQIDVEQTDEKLKQLNILQDVLGIAIKTHVTESKKDNKKIKSKLGMIRFDPTNPEHSKFLAAANETKQDSSTKQSKKNKSKKEKEPTEEQPVQEIEKVKVSKEQFYKVDENLKEAFTQPNTFSLRSLFTKEEEPETDDLGQETGYIPLETPKETKVKNPLDPGMKNPFVYDSSESETEEVDVKETNQSQEKTEVKAIWKENFFFSKFDDRFKEGVTFFSKPKDNEGQKERRELKSLMKKRIYNTERKKQMFQKKIGGRKKNMKKSYKKRN